MNKTEPENRGISEDLFRILHNRFENSRPLQTLGINLWYFGKGQAGIKMIPGKEYINVTGMLHGGIIATLADTAMGWTVLSLGNTGYTVEFNLNYLSAVREGTELRAEGYVIQAGKTVAVIGANLLNEDGKLIATSRGTFIIDNKATIPASK